MYGEKITHQKRVRRDSPLKEFNVKYEFYQPNKKIRLTDGVGQQNKVNLLEIMNERTNETIHFELYRDSEVGMD